MTNWADLKAGATRVGALRNLVELLGCQWGRLVFATDDQQPCGAAADGIVVLWKDGERCMDVKLCRAHMARIDQETDPHAFPEGGCSDEGS